MKKLILAGTESKTLCSTFYVARQLRWLANRNLWNEIWLMLGDDCLIDDGVCKWGRVL